MNNQQLNPIANDRSGCVNVRRAGADRLRHGLSILEVLFAIGVLTIGLMGVAFILPVATNHAATSLRDDRTTEEINNRVATDFARISRNITHMVAAENSASTPAYYNAINPPLPAPQRATDQGFDTNGRQRFSDVSLELLPRAFVIDPLFMNAANNLRFNANVALVNGYDRTLFPCYDRNFVPTLSPSAAISTSQAVVWNWPLPSPGGRNVLWNTPRFDRVSLPANLANLAPGFTLARASQTSGDDFSVVVSEDSTRGAGLFVQRSANPMRSLTRSTQTGRFSSMVMMSRSHAGSNIYNAAVVTMQDRQLVTVPGGELLPTGDDLKHQLRPYPAAAPGTSQPLDEELTYPGEVMGYVNYAPRPFIGGGGGEFIFRTSAFTRPNVKEGSWVCLMRQDYYDDAPITAPPNYRREILTPTGRFNVFDSNPEGPLHFGWFRVTAVTVKPTLDATSTYYQTQVAVRGPDWVFHPSQVSTVSAVGNLYTPPYRPAPLGPLPTGVAPAYDFDITGHPDFGTIAVLMPDVLSVYQFPFEFK